MTEMITVERVGRVAVLKFNRPKQLNALNAQLAAELVETASTLDRDRDLGCFVLTGNEKAFAAGADIAEMQERTYPEMADEDYFSIWEEFSAIRTPKIAAVNGFALGGGCEVAMLCDFVIAGRSAKFGQPEIKLGVIPGIGGSQRLSRLVGRGLAMDLILTGRMMDAEEAKSAGLVARLVDDDKVLETAIAAAAQIASYSKSAVRWAREAVNRSDEVTLREGILFERRVFHSLFATQDQKEGMQAFIEKRTPKFSGK
ncbi:enoyl-CoA hydratase/isomerase family protein [Ensifer sp. ENS07]|uniref:enoyl-CoA hydratase-related protein n=1 Tax=Ensifer sp. ENS07 TaxID=2769274 RepID=UPI00177D2600|nr:enoyl-CoA hydratase-related protein [Ensifer sp. ENS07]MBD9638777.1 enoyl-CoA hydratase/isomerase family protein [Ensifer sp. ENS07]